MDTSKKMAMRVWLWMAVLFFVIAFVIGFFYALLLSIAALAAWKIYEYTKLRKFWDQKATPAKKTIEYASAFIKGQSEINNVWIYALQQPGMAKSATDYQVQLMAEIIVLSEKENPIESWIEWGADRLDTHVNSLSDEERRENFADIGTPMTLETLMINRVAFENIVAEFALKLLGVSDPRALIAQKLTARALSRLHALDTSYSS